MYRISTDGKTYSERVYDRDEMLAVVEGIAAGRNYGWRWEGDDSDVKECVCDYEVILRIVAAA